MRGGQDEAGVVLWRGGQVWRQVLGEGRVLADVVDGEGDEERGDVLGRRVSVQQELAQTGERGPGELVAGGLAAGEDVVLVGEQPFHGEHAHERAVDFGEVFAEDDARGRPRRLLRGGCARFDGGTGMLQMRQLGCKGGRKRAQHDVIAVGFKAGEERHGTVGWWIVGGVGVEWECLCRIGRSSLILSISRVMAVRRTGGCASAVVRYLLNCGAQTIHKYVHPAKPAVFIRA